MEFIYPAAFAGLAAIPLLFALNLWRYRRLRLTVSSLIIWKRLSQHAQAPPSSRQRYFNLSLLMQIFVVVFLSFATAGPRIRQTAADSRTVHVLIDRSASTEANSAGSRVFDRITLSAALLLRSLSESDTVYCHTFPGPSGPETVGPLSQEEAQHWLSQLKPTQLAGSPSRAALRAAARAATGSNQVFMFTDQPVADLPDSVRASILPADPDNCAITALKPAEDENGLHIFFKIANFSGSTRTLDWEVIGSSGRRYTQENHSAAEIRNGEETGAGFTLPSEASAEDMLEVRLTEPGPGDALSSDNSAYVFRNPAAELRISYVGRQDRDLLRALTALPGAVVTFSDEPEPGCVLAVFNEVSPPETIRCNTVAIAPPQGIHGLIVVPDSQVYKPGQPLDSKATELAASPDWASTITVEKALKGTRLARRGSSVILADGQIPLVVDFSLEGRRMIYIGFKLTDTNWTNQVSFPLFWGLLAEQVGAAESRWTTCSTGGTVSFPSRDLTGITAPGGTTSTPEKTGPWTLFRPDRTGVYQANYTQGKRLFGVSLLNPGESRLNDRDVPFDKSWLAPPQASGTQSQPTWLWQYFAFFAAASMLASWLLWRERKKD